jgi:Phosphodiester glycosidase
MNRLFYWIICVPLLAFSLALVGSSQPALAQTGAPTPSPPPLTSTPTPIPVTSTPTTIPPTDTPVPTPLTDIPPDFRLIDAALGVQLYRKDYSNGNPDFVQVIDLSQGARVELLHGDITEDRPEKGSFGGPDPRMTSPALQTFWQRAMSEDPDAFCVTNGTFFYMPEYPTRLAFPLKVSGQVVTEGWGIDTYVGQQLLLELWSDQARIRNSDETALYSSTAPDIVGGLTEQANKRAKFAVGRTFIGLDDQNQDGKQETMLILNTMTASQSGAAAVLRDFGAEQVMMLDGGGSTQLLCKSGWHVRSDRPIPQALAVFAAEPPPVSVQLVNGPEWSVLVQGEAFPFEMEIRNTGVVSWTEQTVQLEVNPGTFGMNRWLPVEKTILPGQQAVFSDTLSKLFKPGLYTSPISWQVIYEDKAYPGQRMEAVAIVLPEELAAKRDELKQKIQSWKGLPKQQVQSLVNAWVEEQSGKTLPTVAAVEPAPSEPVQGQIRPMDAMLIPLLMLPIVLIVGFILARKNTGN